MASSKLCSASLWIHVIYAIEKRLTNEIMPLQIDGLMNIMFFGHLWLFYSVNTWDLKCNNMTSVGQL